MDCVKQLTIYNKELDLVNLKEELGDLLFYIFGILNATNITIYDCMESNQWKLAERYKSKTYSDQAAIDRADKLTRCPSCNGDGYSRKVSLGENPCEQCNGIGTV
jgi:uncharacterized protein YabN with tetrapyrrole methylase and pyrophosphatase domain